MSRGRGTDHAAGTGAGAGADEVPIVETGPESLFRIGPVTHDGSGVSASMPLGDWLATSDGSVVAGAVGVLLDDVLGYAIIADRPLGQWSVSTEITLDVLEPLPLGGTIHAEAGVVHVDALGGFATGRITDDGGRLVAVGTQRGRFVAAHGAGTTATAYSPVEGSTDVVPWLARTFVGAEPLVVPDLLANPMGNLHGGISLCLSDLVARDAVAEHLTTSSIHITYPRGVPVGATLSYDAQVRHAGRSLAVVEVTGTASGRVATVAQIVLHPGG